MYNFDLTGLVAILFAGLCLAALMVVLLFVFIFVSPGAWVVWYVAGSLVLSVGVGVYMEFWS